MPRSAHNLLKKMAEKEKSFRQKDFLAPYMENSKFAVVKMEGMNYTFRIVGFEGSGIGVFKPIDPTCAKFVKPANNEQRRAYFDVLPKIHFILAYEIEEGWVAYPMHMQSATVSLGLESEAVIKNITDCERFDVITARFDGIHFWHDEVFVGADLMKSDEMRSCFVGEDTPQQMKMALAKVKGLTLEDRKAFDLAIISWTLFQRMTTEQRLQRLLQEGGATLGSYVPRGQSIEVRWKSGTGQKYTSRVHKDTFDVESAGICLSGGDTKFHLRDLPYVIAEGEKQDVIYRMDN